MARGGKRGTGGGAKPDGRDVLVSMGKKGKKGASRPRGAAGSGGGRGFLAALKSWTVCVVVSALVGGALGGALVLGGMYREALSLVEEDTGAKVASVPGRVLSGPIVLWKGLSLAPDELGEDLQAAGYARVPKAAQGGDFSVGVDRVTVLVRTDAGPGWRTTAGSLTVTFKAGRVAGLSGTAVADGRATLAPVLLASVRGKDNEEARPVATLEAIPAHVRHAVLAMEDARFYEHSGIDPLGLLRAVWTNATAGEWVQGGSSITQQLVKNVYLSSERTAARKIMEALVALALERTHTKDEILLRYLNEIYLGQVGGGSICGVDAAARGYFGKPVGRLNVAEGAVLAGIISSPNPYSPLRHPDKARERRDLALIRLEQVYPREHGDDARAARALPLVTHADSRGRRSPWAADRAIEEAEAALGEGRVADEAMLVHTSVHPVLQRLAERAVTEGFAEVSRQHPGLAEAQVAMAVVDARDGGIVALVGSRDWTTSMWDRASQAQRQVGSTVKPFTVLAAFEADERLSPLSLLDDSPLTLQHDGKDWSPQNYDKAFVGEVTLRRALAASRNVPAVRLAQHVGFDGLRDRLHQVGLAHATDYPSTSLGGFEATPVTLAAAYGVFANGTWHAPWLIRGVRARDGATLEDRPPAKADVRFGKRATFLARSVLREVLDTGTGKAARAMGVGSGAAGKSGTTDGTVDTWFAGVTGEYAVAVWVGFDAQKPTGLTGGQAALPIWARFVSATGRDGVTLPVPEGVERVEVCVSSDAPACGTACETREEFVPTGAGPECDLGDWARTLLRSDGRTPDGSEGKADRGEPRARPLEDGAPPVASPVRRKRRWFGLGGD
jgi:penicillin-binding protein 1B